MYLEMKYLLEVSWDAREVDGVWVMLNCPWDDGLMVGLGWVETVSGVGAPLVVGLKCRCGGVSGIWR